MYEIRIIFYKDLIFLIKFNLSTFYMSQISTLLKKNAIQVLRSGEIFMDILVPMLIAVMLALK